MTVETLPGKASARELARHESASAVARALLEGFDKHYRIFRDASRAAKQRFEGGDWVAAQEANRERIQFYDRRVYEAAERLEREFQADSLDNALWQQIKLIYIGLLTNHKQPELAETFFNSVCCKILHRTYFRNEFIFVRPAVSTEHIDSEPPAYRCYYPSKFGLRGTLLQIAHDFGVRRAFAHLRQDLRAVLRVWRRQLPRPFVLEANHQIQVLSSLFYRNKGAYVVGKVINGNQDYPFVVPLLCDGQGKLYLDTVLLSRYHLDIFFSPNRAYFMVDMEVPSAYVEFLRGMLPYKPKWEIYTILGLQKHGKALFYRDFLHHLKHSSDDFVIAPGIKGLVMLVFTLPSYPYVFKVIRDFVAPPKDIDRETVKKKYLMVKYHDRVGRMADTLEYSDVAFPKNRFTQALLEELRKLAPSLLEEEGETLIIKHLYIERRMTPLNLYLDRADDEERMHAIREYGTAIKQLAAANIFAGDLLFKNFGLTRYNRVVFYDYDEIDYLTNCNFRRIPPPRSLEDELAAEPWYSVLPHDIFPEEFTHFLLPDPKVRECFLAYHKDLLDPEYWKATQQRIAAGQVEDVFPYPESLRFRGARHAGANRPQLTG
jgi:isocitrate dehydrogenase kinase/phosphatase